MVKHFPFGRKRRAKREAARWFARLQGDDVTLSEIESCQRWLGEHEENRSAFLNCERSMQLLAASRGTDQVRTMLVEARQRRRERVDRPQRYGISGVGRRSITGVVAALCALVAIGTIVIPQRPDEYSTGLAEQRIVLLEDGSHIHLNADSRALVEYGASERNVLILHGDVVFSVAREPDRPFIVNAGKARVRAVGTEFSVRFREENVSVAVLEGIVAVSSQPGTGTMKAAPVQFGAGQAVTVDRNGAPSMIESVNAARVASWRKGRLYFDAVRLGDAIEEINLHSAVAIRLGSPELEGELISGVFKTGDIGGFLFAVERVLDLQSVHQEDKIVLFRARGSHSVKLRN